MLLGVNGLEILINDMGIGHSGLNTFVAEKLLHINDIGIIAEQIGSE